MKITSVLATIGLLASTTVAAPSANQEYWLKIVGGNSLINGRRLRTNGTTIPGVTAPAYNKEDHFCRVKLSTDLHTLTVVPTHPHPPPVTGYYALIGPSGRGLNHLEETWHPTPVGVGSQIQYKDWRIVTTSDGRMLLRYNDVACQSHWVVVQQTTNAGVKKWLPYWYTPAPQNMDELTGYEMIDIEIIAAKPGVNS